VSRWKSVFFLSSKVMGIAVDVLLAAMSTLVVITSLSLYIQVLTSKEYSTHEKLSHGTRDP